MKILLVTGRLAYKWVLEVAKRVKKEYGIDVDVVEFPLPVAAMINSSYLMREVHRVKSKLSGVDVVIVPGYSEGDMSEVSRLIGVPVLKGPRNIHDLPLMVKAMLEGIGFSPTSPADEVLKDYLQKLDLEAISRAKDRAYRTARALIGSLPVSPDYPIVMLEIYVNSAEALEQYIRAAQYADAVVLGFPYGFKPADATKIVDSAKDVFKKPIGVDTADFELLTGVLEHVDLINGLPAGNVQEFAEKFGHFKEKAIVLVAEGDSPTRRLHSLKKGVKLLAERGFVNILLDPVLMPPLQGLSGSLEAYFLVKRELAEKPVLMGIGNVTELVDVDSVGVCALLAFIGVEIGAEAYLITEASTKTRRSTMELRRALDMAVIARELKRTPKDLSVNLLVVKSKKKYACSLPRAEVSIYASEKPVYAQDPKGYFKVHVDPSRGELIVQHYPHGSQTPDVEVRGRDPYAILAEILKRGLASMPGHFFYLGYELAKAKSALDIGREYEQDKELFSG